RSIHLSAERQTPTAAAAVAKQQRRPLTTPTKLQQQRSLEHQQQRRSSRPFQTIRHLVFGTDRSQSVDDDHWEVKERKG
ncbi:hypothetical protein MMC07_009186, partial [Pseudocyphellaria aurata]|nr:hypothetical protein [Pseudocyphellaria aurata]